MEGGTQQLNLGVGSLTSALYDYVFINDGGSVTIAGLVASGSNDASTYYYDSADTNWRNDYTHDTGVTGAKTLYIATEATQLDLTTTGIAEYSEPAAPASTMVTNWNKAVDFSGGSEYAQQVSILFNYNPLNMRGRASVVPTPAVAGNTTAGIDGAPWATAIVFQPDGNASNQHIWNCGEGQGAGNDNIYLRVDANGNLYFGWGRDGALNECVIGAGFNAGAGINQFWGVYIAHNGARLSGANATAANLAACFDIRIMNNQGGTWQIAGAGGTFADADGNRSTTTNWNRSGSSTGGRMDRGFSGGVSVGGRYNNRSFHGKVASFVITTLRRDVAMPTTAEIEEMITDPIGWLDDYKVGNPYRRSSSAYDTASFAKDQYGGTSTQVWLMGDGTNDSYSNMIRNQVHINDQNSTMMRLISMVSNDIQNVTIPGLS